MKTIKFFFYVCGLVLLIFTGYIVYNSGGASDYLQENYDRSQASDEAMQWCGKNGSFGRSVNDAGEYYNFRCSFYKNTACKERKTISCVIGVNRFNMKEDWQGFFLLLIFCIGGLISFQKYIQGEKQASKHILLML